MTRVPPIVAPAAWDAARAELLAEEKAQTRALDALAARRRRLETLGTVWTLLDTTPLGRREAWETTPAGRTDTTRPQPGPIEVM